VAQWVDRTHLGERLVYFPRCFPIGRPMSRRRPPAVLRKLVLKPDSPVLRLAEKRDRFAVLTCLLRHPGTIRREKQALTRSGQNQDQAAAGTRRTIVIGSTIGLALHPRMVK